MKTLCLLLFCCFISIISYAQVADTVYVEEPLIRESRFDRSKLYYGGYLNMSFGKYTLIGATPLVGYKLSPKFSVGSQFTYEYVRDKRYTRDYENSNYGISIFSRYRMFPTMYVHAEFSEMNYKLYNYDGFSTRKWIPFLWLGGGLSQRISRNTWLNTQVLFDVINHKNSPYKDWEPYLSVGFGVGF